MSIRNTIILSLLMFSQLAFSFNAKLDPFAGQENFIPLDEIIPETSSPLRIAKKRLRPNFSDTDIPASPTKLAKLDIDLLEAELKILQVGVENHDLQMEILQLKRLISSLEQKNKSLLNQLNRAQTAADEYLRSNRVNREEVSNLHRARSVLRDDCDKFCRENTQGKKEIELLKTDLLQIANCQTEEGEIHEIFQRQYRKGDYRKYCQ